jgi:hypothetical protein
MSTGKVVYRRRTNNVVKDLKTKNQKNTNSKKSSTADQFGTALVLVVIGFLFYYLVMGIIHSPSKVDISNDYVSLGPNKEMYFACGYTSPAKDMAVLVTSFNVDGASNDLLKVTHQNEYFKDLTFMDYLKMFTFQGNKFYIKLTNTADRELYVTFKRAVYRYF